MDDHQNNRNDVQTVHVRHLGELETTNLKVPEDVTLQGIWDQAYAKLNVPRDDRDVFQAEFHGRPVSLMDHLGLTLKSAQDQDLCKKSFEIAAKTGGA